MMMPQKGYRKPGSARDQKEVQQRSNRAIKGLDATMDAIIAKLESGKSLTDEEVRLVKRYNDIRTSITAKEDIKDTKGLPPGKLKEDIEKAWKLNIIMEAAGYPKSKEGHDQVLIDFGYYRCDLCGEAHTNGSVCPFEQLISDLKLDIKAPSDKDLDSLL
jgi:hypothetical protein